MSKNKLISILATIILASCNKPNKGRDNLGYIADISIINQRVVSLKNYPGTALLRGNSRAFLPDTHYKISLNEKIQTVEDKKGVITAVDEERIYVLSTSRETGYLDSFDKELTPLNSLSFPLEAPIHWGAVSTEINRIFLWSEVPGDFSLKGFNPKEIYPVKFSFPGSIKQESIRILNASYRGKTLYGYSIRNDEGKYLSEKFTLLPDGRMFFKELLCKESDNSVIRVHETPEGHYMVKKKNYKNKKLINTRNNNPYKDIILEYHSYKNSNIIRLEVNNFEYISDDFRFLADRDSVFQIHRDHRDISLTPIIVSDDNLITSGIKLFDNRLFIYGYTYLKEKRYFDYTDIKAYLEIVPMSLY